ncbi:hypothetical protein NKH77_53110 [Streptomyces sp. M19]
MDVVLSHLDVFGRGLLVSARLSACTFVLAGLLGLLLACCRISPVVPCACSRGATSSRCGRSAHGPVDALRLRTA